MKIRIGLGIRFLMGIVFCVFMLSVLPTLLIANVGEELMTRVSYKKISMDLDGTPLFQVLRIFSQESGLNFIANDDVQEKKITAFLENVPFREALEKILTSYHLACEIDEGSNVFIVKELTKPEMTTKVYTLKYARLQSSPVESKAKSNIVAAVKELLSSNDAKLQEDVRTNSMIITDIPQQFSKIEATIAKLDIPIPQVLIEVEIIDTTLNVVDKLGLKWENGISYNTGLSTYTKLFGLPFKTFENTKSVTAKDLTSTSNIALELLHVDINTKILARPKIRTFSNETSEINISNDEVVGTKKTFDPNGNVTGTDPERMDVGVILKVTPYVNLETREIAMSLEPEVSDSKASFISGYRDKTKRTAKTTLAVKDGETIVMGGLLKKKETTIKTKVPFLSDIPLVGALFRHKSKGAESADEDRELLIFITPHIIQPGTVDLVKSQAYDKEIPLEREQADFYQRRDAIDETLSQWEK